jgi:hypothetical protein
MAYETYRRVVVKELWWLNAMYWGLLATAIIAAVLWMFAAQGHLKAVPTSASVFIHGANADDPTRMRCSSVTTTTAEGDAVPCVEWDWLELIDTSASHAFITTYVVEQLQERACPRSVAHCDEVPLWRDVANVSYSTAGPEYMSLVLEHSPDGVASMESVRGRLLPRDEDGVVSDDERLAAFTTTHHASTVKTAVPPTDPADNVTSVVGNGYDTLAVLEILNSAGVPLLYVPNGKVRQLPDEYRRRGLHVDLQLRYGNVWIDDATDDDDDDDVDDWVSSVSKTVGSFVSRVTSRLLPSDLRYTYVASFKPTTHGARMILTADSSRLLTYNGSSEARIVKSFYGVRIAVRSSGSELHEVDASAALRWLTGAATLLSWPFLVTELVLTLLSARYASMDEHRAPRWYYRGFTRIAGPSPSAAAPVAAEPRPHAD